MTSSSVAVERATRMLSRIVPPNRNPSCGHDDHSLAQRVERRQPQVDVGVRHEAAARVVQPGEQLGDGALAGTGRTDEGEPLAVRDRQRQVAERRPLGAGVGERHVVGDERAGGRQVDRVGVLGDVGHGVDQLVQLVQRGGRALHRVVQLAELLHRVEQVGQPQHERGDRADGDRVAVHHPPADADDDGHGEHPGGLDQPEVQGADLHRVQVAAVQRLVALVEAPGLLLLAVVRLDDPHAGDALLQRAEVLADLLAHVEVGDVAPALEAHGGDGEDRHDDEHGQRQLPADHQHHQDRDDDEQAGADELQQAPLDQLAHALDVGRHPGHEHAGLVAVVVGHRLGLQPVEDPDAQLAQEALAGDVDRQVLLATEDVVGDRRPRRRRR